ncbi:GNAT family N-acetyltransferase [Paenibacillus tuaregi]|uniref:GNAT family N-acetyltransferase n=1 Tax=Paenibacillus tuaregi TaxID=1816681 RepID=UPI0008383B1D|nr:GNAT family N-acetyltransferase [Paenibacillus tuaregi]
MDSFHITPASLTDAQAITDLIILCDIDEYGAPDIVLEDTLDILQGLDLDKDTWIVRAQGGAVIGFAFCEKQSGGRLMAYGYVHPEYKGRGIGTELLEFLERRGGELSRSAEREDTVWRLSNVIPALNEQARSLLLSRGYEFVRLYSRMNIQFTSAPPKPAAVEAISISPFRPGIDEHQVFKAYSDAFQDHRLYSETTEEAWLMERSGEHYDRSLWFTAREGDEVAGFLISKNFGDHVFVDLLGVRRAYRKRGIALALLQHAFQEAYRQGITQVLLSVDAESPTGAHRLYKQAGMEALFQMAMYDKVI